MGKSKPVFDLYISPSITDIDVALLLAKHLGYSGVGLQLTSNEELAEIFSKVKEISSKLDIDILFRIDASSSIKIDKTLSRIADRYIVTLHIASEDEFRKKLRMRDVRVLSLDFSDFVKILSRENLNLLRQYPDKYVEVRLISLLKMTRKERSFVLATLYKKIKLLNSQKLPLIVSSGAKNLNEFLSPRCIRSFLKLIGVNEKKILELISVNPQRLFRLPRPVILIGDE